MSLKPSSASSKCQKLLGALVASVLVFLRKRVTARPALPRFTKELRRFG